MFYMSPQVFQAKWKTDSNCENGVMTLTIDWNNEVSEHKCNVYND